MTLKINEKDLIWLAGIIEGDGCIRIERKFLATLLLGLADEDVIKKVADLLDTNYHSSQGAMEHYKEIFRLKIRSEKAISIINELYPYMGKRRQEKINEVNEKWEQHCDNSFLVNKKASLINRDLLLKEYASSSHRKLASKHGVSFSTIQRVLSGDHKTHFRTSFDLEILKDGLPKDIYWLAGLLEAEGSFMKGPPSSPNDPRITIQMTDEDIIEKVANLFAVSYQGCQRNKLTKSGGLCKKIYSVSLRGKRAVEWMLKLRPLMGQRRQQQIETALLSHDPEKIAKASQKRCLLKENQVLTAEKKIAEGNSLRSVSRELNVHHTVLRDAIIRKTKLTNRLYTHIG